MQSITIHTPFIKLDQLLKYAAVAETGGDAKNLISDGCVTVNESICTMRGKKIVPGDCITVNCENQKITLRVEADDH